MGDSSEPVLLPSSPCPSCPPSQITREFGVLILSGMKLGGSKYGDFAVVILLFVSTSCDGRIGDRHVRLKDACRGEAAVVMASLMKELENRLGVDVEDSGGGAIAFSTVWWCVRLGRRAGHVVPPWSARLR